MSPVHSQCFQKVMMGKLRLIMSLRGLGFSGLLVCGDRFECLGVPRFLFSGHKNKVGLMTIGVSGFYVGF